MNIALEGTREFVDGKMRRSYGDAFVRGNNGALYFTRLAEPLGLMLRGNSLTFGSCQSHTFLPTSRLSSSRLDEQSVEDTSYDLLERLRKHEMAKDYCTWCACRHALQFR
jgi:hypothetical protein